KIVAQMIVDLVGESENFPRVENVFRIECALDLAHDVEESITELIAHIFRSRDADAMLGGNRAFELPNERRRLIGNQTNFSQIIGAVEGEERSNVKQAARRMTVVACF